MTCTHAVPESRRCGPSRFCWNCGASLSSLKGLVAGIGTNILRAAVDFSRKRDGHVGSRTERSLALHLGKHPGLISKSLGNRRCLLALVSLYRGLSSFKMRIALLWLRPPLFVTGIGILRKRSYSLVLVFICMILTVVMYYQVLFLLPSARRTPCLWRALLLDSFVFSIIFAVAGLEPGW